MFNVLLVDDESHALSGIRRTFPWEDFGFIVACATTDSSEAAEVLKRGDIDLAFVDVKMPVISGLDLIHMARRNSLPTEFIIVSGYSDFPMAQDAIRHKVLDYCIKPIRAARAREILRNACMHLAVKAEERSRGKLREALLHPEIMEPWFRPLEGSYQAFILRGAGDGSCPSFLSGRRPYGISLPEEAVYIVRSPEPIAVESSGCASSETVGIGGRVTELSDVSRSVGQAREALESAHLYPKERVFPYSPIRVAKIKGLALRLIRETNAGDPEKEEALLGDLAGTMRSFLFSERELDHLQASLIQALAPDMSISRFDDIDGYCFYIGKMLAGRPRKGKGTAEERMGRILEFVNENAGNRLSLDLIARKFHMNPKYAGEYFKKGAGTTFSRYLLEARMRTAKRLLLDPSKTLKEIASETGFEYFHFCRTFKKYTGTSPSRYRHGGSDGRH